VKRFCIPPMHNAAFVQSMQDVLDVFPLPYDPQRPVACFDETSKQLVLHARPALPVRPPMAERVDDEYKRCGTANLFRAVEPLTGEVILQPTHRRTAVDGAEFLRYLATRCIHRRPRSCWSATTLTPALPSVSTRRLRRSRRVREACDSRYTTRRNTEAGSASSHHVKRNGAFVIHNWVSTRSCPRRSCWSGRAVASFAGGKRVNPLVCIEIPLRPMDGWWSRPPCSNAQAAAIVEV